MSGPCRDLIVLDFTWGMAGGLAAMVLSDFGARVIQTARETGLAAGVGLSGETDLLGYQIDVTWTDHGRLGDVSPSQAGEHPVALFLIVARVDNASVAVAARIAEIPHAVWIRRTTAAVVVAAVRPFATGATGSFDGIRYAVKKLVRDGVGQGPYVHHGPFLRDPGHDMVLAQDPSPSD